MNEELSQLVFRHCGQELLGHYPSVVVIKCSWSAKHRQIYGKTNMCYSFI